MKACHCALPTLRGDDDCCKNCNETPSNQQIKKAMENFEYNYEEDDFDNCFEDNLQETNELFKKYLENRDYKIL